METQCNFVLYKNQIIIIIIVIIIIFFIRNCERHIVQFFSKNVECLLFTADESVLHMHTMVSHQLSEMASQWQAFCLPYVFICAFPASASCLS